MVQQSSRLKTQPSNSLRADSISQSDDVRQVSQWGGVHQEHAVSNGG